MPKFLAKLLAVIFAIILIISIIGFFTDTTATLPKSVAGQHITIEGSNLRVFQQGHGQDVLLIHGLPGSIEDWESVTPELAKHYRVTVYDRPGYGYSDYSKDLSNLKGNTNIALKLIKALALKNVIVVGHSYGGAITAAMASRRPESVDAFISIAGVIDRDGPVETIYKVLSIPYFGAGVAKIANQFIGRSMMEDGIPKAFFPNNNVMPENYIEKRAPMWLNVKSSLAVTWEKLTMHEELDAIELAAIQHPFYILQGDSDQSVPKEHGKIMKREISNSELKILEDTGHFIQYSHPDLVITTIDKAAKGLAQVQTAQQP